MHNASIYKNTGQLNEVKRCEFTVGRCFKVDRSECKQSVLVRQGFTIMVCTQLKRKAVATLVALCVAI